MLLRLCHICSDTAVMYQQLSYYLGYYSMMNCVQPSGQLCVPDVVHK